MVDTVTASARTWRSEASKAQRRAYGRAYVKRPEVKERRRMRDNHPRSQLCPQGHNDWAITKRGWRRCRTCDNARTKAYAQANRVRQRAWAKAWEQRNPAYVAFKGARTRAKLECVPFTLTREEVTELWDNKGHCCPVLGIPWNGSKESQPELDRLIPEQGYTKQNVAFVSRRANRLKNDGTLSEHKAIVRWMEKYDG